MYLISKKAAFIFLLFSSSVSYSQKVNDSSVELGMLVAGDEAVYYGGYGKYSMPLSQNKNYFTLGFAIVAYFDFKGESEPEAYLKNDIDMRIIPTVNLGYSINYRNVQLNLEAPVGLSFATTKGTLINKKIGFERAFSNKETFLNYGLNISPKYKLNDTNSVGFHCFIPLVDDKTRSGYQFGIGWTNTIASKEPLVKSK